MSTQKKSIKFEFYQSLKKHYKIIIKENNNELMAEI